MHYTKHELYNAMREDINAWPSDDRYTPRLSVDEPTDEHRHLKNT